MTSIKCSSLPQSVSQFFLSRFHPPQLDSPGKAGEFLSRKHLSFLKRDSLAIGFIMLSASSTVIDIEFDLQYSLFSHFYTNNVTTNATATVETLPAELLVILSGSSYLSFS